MASTELPACYAMVHHGLEEIAGEEITQALGGVIKKSGGGIVVFRVDDIDRDLLQLRTTEDVFLYGWGTDELSYRAKDLDSIERWTDRSARWYSAVTQIAESMTVNEIGEVAWERQIGFLHLLEQTVRLVGFGVTEHVGVLLKVVLAMLSGSQTGAWRSRNSSLDLSGSNPN